MDSNTESIDVSIANSSVNRNVVVDPDALVKQANILIEATTNLTKNEHKILLLLLAEINIDKPSSFCKYTFTIRDISKALGLVKSGTNYHNIIDTVKSLMETVIHFPHNGQHPDLPDGQMYHWIEAVPSYNHSTITMRISPELKDILLRLSKPWTVYVLSNVLKLTSSYSIRLYQLLIQYQNADKKNPGHWVRDFDIPTLREQLGVAPETFPEYSNLKQMVIGRAAKEVSEKTNIVVSLQTLQKKAKKVSSIRFVVERKSSFSVIYNPPSKSQSPGTSRVVDSPESIERQEREASLEAILAMCPAELQRLINEAEEEAFGDTTNPAFNLASEDIRRRAARSKVLDQYRDRIIDSQP